MTTSYLLTNCSNLGNSRPGDDDSDDDDNNNDNDDDTKACATNYKPNYYYYKQNVAKQSSNSNLKTLAFSPRTHKEQWYADKKLTYCIYMQ